MMDSSIAAAADDDDDALNEALSMLHSLTDNGDATNGGFAIDSDSDNDDNDVTKFNLEDAFPLFIV